MAGLSGHLYAFKGIFLCQCTERRYLLVLLKFQIFGGMPDIPNICLVNTRCRVQAKV